MCCLLETLPVVWLWASCFPSKPAAENRPILLRRLVATIGRNWSNYATKTSDGMSSDEAEDDSDVGECFCGEVPCLCIAKLAEPPKNPYAALPKRVSQPPKKTTGGIKQPPKKARKPRKSQQKASAVITVRKRKGVSSHARDFKLAVRDYNTAYMKALNATSDEDRQEHQEEQAKHLALILHTEEVLRSNQFLPFDPAASVLKSTQALVALKKKAAKKKQEEEEAAAAVG